MSIPVSSPVPLQASTPLLRLLGPPAWRHGGHETPWPPERPYLLLALLACRRDWLARDELADALYPGRDIAAARSNLRKVLHLARQLDGAEALEQRGDLLRWAPDSDLARFEAACSAQQHAEAVALYGGPLLMGLDGAFPGEAAEWLHAERQRLHARWHEACSRRLVELAGDPAAAGELAQALLRADPLDEAALQALARAQQAQGRPAEALAALRGYEQRLTRDVGLRPSVAVQALDDELQGRGRPAAGPAEAPAALVGRRQELAQIAERLAEPGCRVLTLLGGPGTGKSTLARAVQARHDPPAVWVPLEDLQQADQVPERVAALAGLALDGREPAWPALARALAGRPVLLVLDNAEHLPLATQLGTLLAACPALQLLVASREPVGVAGEWRLPIAGLPLPDLDETDPEVLRANDAVLLFERRARPLAPAFDLAAEAAEVVRLVHEVEGLPLAIELLAAWRRLMPVREILAELADSLDLLEPATPSERSVRASFNRAWQQLGPLEQQVLAGMAVLPGPLSRAQVRGVLQAPLPVLAALADRSLLRAEDNGRFTLHPLIRRCAAPLALDVAPLRERHARQLAQRVAAGDAAGLEGAQLEAAWGWAVEQADPMVLRTLARALPSLVPQRSSREQWLPRLEAAHRALLRLAPRINGSEPLAGPAREGGQALARLTLTWSDLLYALGDLDQADTRALESLAWARRLDDLGMQASALTRRAGVAWQRGDYDTALAHSDLTLDLERQAGVPETKSSAFGFRALFLKGLGRYDEARAIQERLVDEARREGISGKTLYLFNNLGNLLRLLGRGREALDLLHEALQLARTQGARPEEPFLLTNVALAHETLRETEVALRWADQALQSSRETGEPMIEAAALLLQARLGAALRRPLGESLAATHEALRIGQRLKSEPLVVQCLCSAGVALARSGRRPQGLALVRWAQRQPAFARSEREDAERHLATLNVDPSEETGALRLLPPETPLAEVLTLLPQLAAS